MARNTFKPVLTCVLILAAILGVCFVFGWLKTLYYHQAFGISLGLLDPSPWAVLLESWFVVQNLLFFVLMWWLVLKTRLAWTAGVGLLYALIPIASHYAFAWHDNPAAWWFLDHRHTLLKFVPFAVLGLVLWLHRSARRSLGDLSWPYTQGGLVLFVAIVLSWGISAAKHFGSYDANRAMKLTGQHLPRVHVELSAGSDIDLPTTGDDLYLLHADGETLIVWDRSGFVYGRSTELRVLVIPRSDVDWFEARRTFETQPSSQYL